MDFFLGLLSSGQKFHFCSADSCYLHKLACLSRNLLNEQEITKNMDHYERTARWSGMFLPRRLIQIPRGGLRLYIFVSTNNRWTPKLYYISGRLKEVMCCSLKEICWKIILSYPRSKPRFQLANIVYFLQITDMFTTYQTRSPSSGNFYRKYFRLNRESQKPCC